MSKNVEIALIIDGEIIDSDDGWEGCDVTVNMAKQILLSEVGNMLEKHADKIKEAAYDH